jgi:hypothetical protein
MGDSNNEGSIHDLDISGGRKSSVVDGLRRIEQHHNESPAADDCDRNDQRFLAERAGGRGL